MPVTIDASQVIFQANPTTERMRIDASGNVGIGTSSPSQALEIAGSVRIDNGASFTAYEIYRDNILYGSVGGGLNQFTLQASNSKSINLFEDSGDRDELLLSTGYETMNSLERFCFWGPNVRLRTSTVDGLSNTASFCVETRILETEAPAPPKAPGALSGALSPLGW